MKSTKYYLAKQAFAFGLLLSTPLYAHAQVNDGTKIKDVNSLSDWLIDGSISGYERTNYYSTKNNFYTKGQNQETISYGGGLLYSTARLYGFSVGIGGYLQRGIAHSNDPNRVDSYIGPNLANIGQAYLRWQYKKFTVTGGNQEINVPFASGFDWRIVPELYQGITTKYGDKNNFLSALWITSYKSYTSNSFTKYTNYNANFDSYGHAGMRKTSGFWSVGGKKELVLNPITLTGEAWYFQYNNYAKLSYLQGEIIDNKLSWQPFSGVQVFHETGDGENLAGHVDSQTYGSIIGIKHHSLVASLGYDYIVPHHNAYSNGALVTPYAHHVSSGPFYAQPFLSSTQDLGAGSAYAINIKTSPYLGLIVGGRYSFMDLKSHFEKPSINQSEYMVFAKYEFSGKLTGFNISNSFAIQSQPGKPGFVQNRFQIGYVF